MSVGASATSITGGAWPQYGTGGVPFTGLIPELFAQEFNIEYWATTLMPMITTGKFYEGLLNHGDKVTIPTEPTITISDYEKGAELDIQVPTSTPITMTVERAKYFNIALDDIDAKQSHLDLAGKYVEVALRQITQDIEVQFFDDIKTAADGSNTGPTAGAISGSYDLGAPGAPVLLNPANAGATDPIQFMTSIRAVLEEQNAYAAGQCWVIIPVWARYRMLNSDLKQAYLTGDDVSVIRSGLLGSIDGINIYVSNLLPVSGAETTVLAGNMDAISYISQLNKSENIRSEKTFADLFRSLMVYDWNVRKPEGLINATVSDAAA